MQSYASKCSCDAVSCTGEVLDLEDLGTLGGGVHTLKYFLFKILII